MPGRPPTVQSTSDAHGVLNGWKEIASYLGKSARSVQRWEHDLGLPVHRIPTPDGGSIVYASPAEVDAWRAQQRAHTNGADHPVSALVSTTGVFSRADLHAGTSERPAPVSVRGAAWEWFHATVPRWAALTLTVIAALAGFAVGMLPMPSGVPATWEFEGRQLRAYSARGRVLWAHEFGRPVTHPSTFVRGRGAQDDLNNDGRQETLVPVRFAASPRDAAGESDAVVAFAQNGRRLWSVQPELKLHAGSETFEGPWHVYDIATGSTPEGQRTWIAFSHHTWWPSFAVEVDSRGAQRIRYVQGGRVYTLGYWLSDGKPLLIAGGTAREPGLASAVVIDLTAPAARWPATGSAELSCDACPAADPQAVLLFPTSHVTTALQRPYGWVFRVTRDGAGLQLNINDGFGSGTLVSLTDRLDLTAFERSDQYWHVHRELEGQGRIGHSVDDCPDRVQPLDVSTWTAAAGWSTQSVPLRISLKTPVASN
jgi:hypothetical protein